MLSKVLLPDTSCLIILEKIDRLWLLNELASEVITTRVVEQEYQNQLPKEILVIDTKIPLIQILPELTLDKGELSLISLYPKIENGVLVLDDLKARKVANRLKYKVTGSLGLLLAAKERKLIESLGSELEKIRSKGFYIEQNLVKRLLISAEELPNDM